MKKKGNVHELLVVSHVHLSVLTKHINTEREMNARKNTAQFPDWPLGGKQMGQIQKRRL